MQPMALCHNFIDFIVNFFCERTCSIGVLFQRQRPKQSFSVEGAEPHAPRRHEETLTLPEGGWGGGGAQTVKAGDKEDPEKGITEILRNERQYSEQENMKSFLRKSALRMAKEGSGLPCSVRGYVRSEGEASL